MPRYRCPECLTESEVPAKTDRDVVALYCLRHTGGADGHTRPVYMVCTEPSGVTAPSAPRAGRLVAAGTQAGPVHSRTERRMAGEAEAEPAAASR